MNGLFQYYVCFHLASQWVRVHYYSAARRTTQLNFSTFLFVCLSKWSIQVLMFTVLLYQSLCECVSSYWISECFCSVLRMWPVVLLGNTDAIDDDHWGPFLFAKHYHSLEPILLPFGHLLLYVCAPGCLPASLSCSLTECLFQWSAFLQPNWWLIKWRQGRMDRTQMSFCQCSLS